MLGFEGILPRPGRGIGERLPDCRPRRWWRWLFVAAAFARSGEARAQNVDLTVDVSGLRNYKGRVVLMLWADFGT